MILFKTFYLKHFIKFRNFMENKTIFLKFDKQKNSLKKIRSFSLRQGRLTNGQRYAIDNYWSTIGVEYLDKLLNMEDLFKRNSPIILEIGFGMGASIVEMALENPQYNFLGIEVYLPGIGACLSSLRKANIKNVRIICYDAVDVLENMIPDDSFISVLLFFPDPWHKLKHNKRRIIQPSFVDLVRKKLNNKGIFHIATDWHPYAKHIIKIMTDSSFYRNLSAKGDYIVRPKTRPLTKFEKRGNLLGNSVWDIMFEKL